MNSKKKTENKTKKIYEEENIYMYDCVLDQINFCTHVV